MKFCTARRATASICIGISAGPYHIHCPSCCAMPYEECAEELELYDADFDFGEDVITSIDGICIREVRMHDGSARYIPEVGVVCANHPTAYYGNCPYCDKY